VYKKAKILFFCMIFVAPQIFSQNLQQKKGLLLLQQSSVKPSPTIVSVNKSAVATVNTQPFLSPNYYASQLGFFCKQEIKFEKTAKIPFKFRLGSVEDCDRMEGKKRVN
jgi:hypothetical protein